jgi:hypothetical protein
MHGKPSFLVRTSAEVKASAASQTFDLSSDSVLVAINGLYNNPLMMASM